ncbi:mechanosensitive ion channel domain-containing protein [Nitrosomonas supralitoralis]|uniref:Mechanosensitive ion channel protein MscS n=1 Tax=Nitrosomonas supralitoralis TaxID=2116706 RepID=A0A2P7NVM5_9PROT|nr:mechanosensitive ion channel domain-containing protein [Nitrosomonas supralitoralis]PSJ17524.1 mechanosensitive ion channel protein MscS [Nitrosomonas supralitoralis]
MQLKFLPSLKLFFFIILSSTLVLLVLLSSSAYSKTPSSTIKAIDSARAVVDRSKLEETQRQAAINQLDTARTDELEANVLGERLATLQAETADQPARMERLNKALATSHEHELLEWSKRLPVDADGETLEQILEQEQTIITDLRAQISAAGTDLALILSRPAQAADEIATLRRRIEELSVPIVAQKDEPAALFEARRLSRLSEQHRLQATQDLRLAEQETAMQRQRLHELTLRELRYRLDLHEERVEHLQQRITSRGRYELESLIEQLVKREQELTGGNAVALDAATANLAIGKELIQQNENLARDRIDLASIEQTREHIAVALSDSRTRLDIGGTSERVGRWLWSERRQLESPVRLELHLKMIRNDLADLRLERVMLSEQQRRLLDIDAVVKELIKARPGADDDEHVDVSAQNLLFPLLRKRIELLALLEPLLQRRISALEKSERTLQEQIQDIWELQQMLDRHLLWIPSHGVINSDWLQRLPEGVYDLIKPSRFITIMELSLRNFDRQPLPWLGSLLLVLILLEFRRRAPARIEALAADISRIRRDSYRSTLKTLGWTLLVILPGPVMLILLGQLLQNVGNPERFSHSMGQACMLLALPLLIVQLLYWTSMEQGLGHAHFRWTRQRREALRQALPRIAIVVLPLYFIGSLAFIRQLDLAIDVQARMAIVLSCVVLAWALWRLLDVGRLWVVRGVISEPSTLRKLLRMLLPILLLTIAILALTGYVYTAGMILQALLASFSVIVMVAIGVGLLARWFLLGERRLALHRLDERRSAAAQAAEESGEAMPEPEENITLEQVNTQTRRLLRALRLTLLILGLTWVWAGILPAITRLDEIALWHVSEVGADGATFQQSVTLIAVLLGIFTLVMTTVGARNLPGLIEISLLSHIRIDAASRYAITSVLRYAIVIGGTIVGLSYLGLRWSQLQWMAAALTVGLGFGLQEIFANFVSGIILLFERPFRVGDVITVDGFSGRVTRIRTRATTVLDFDNKEVVIPNKTFITGQLINWTLTDATTRVVIQVGVAYGADVKKVRELLLQIAREDERVLAEPESTCWFVAFGASSLDFELRVFVNSISHRLEVQDALNTRITTLFAEHNIEIAFPQLDLHVRDLPSELIRTQTPVAIKKEESKSDESVYNG